jgi:hypothetical protein
MAIPNDVAARNHQAFIETASGICARRAHVSGGTLAMLQGGTIDTLTSVVGTVNIIAILGTLTTLQNGTLDILKAGTLDMVKAGTVSKVSSGTINTIDSVTTLAAGTLNQLQAGTLDILKAGTIDKLASGTVSMLSAGTVTTVGMVQDGTLSMLKAGTISSVGGTVNVNLATLISGEDQTNDVLKTEQRVSYYNATADGTVKASAGRFFGFYVNSTNSGTISIYDATSITGVAMMGTLVPAAGPHVFPVAVTMATGIYFDLVGGTINATLFYQ